MKLLYAAPSPYVRQILVHAHEAGYLAKLELEPVVVAPTKENATVAAKNPLVKIPTLVLDDGSALHDSRVILEYLDTTEAGGRFLPAAGPERWATLRRVSVADGLLDAAILIRYETFLRPAELRWPDWIAGQYRKVDQALDSLESEVATFGDTLTLGHIAVGCALSYLDFRYADRPWRPAHPKLAAFHEPFAARPSMRTSEPPAG